jgi:hypothetical protein
MQKIVLRKICFIQALIIIAAFSCNKDEPEVIDSQQGLVLFHGDPAVDGCGWLIEIGEEMYSPVNLKSEFQKDSLGVIVDYKILSSEWNCGWREPGYRQIEILNIAISLSGFGDYWN